MKRAKI